MGWYPRQVLWHGKRRLGRWRPSLLFGSGRNESKTAPKPNPSLSIPKAQRAFIMQPRSAGLSSQSAASASHMECGCVARNERSCRFRRANWLTHTTGYSKAEAGGLPPASQHTRATKRSKPVAPPFQGCAAALQMHCVLPRPKPRQLSFVPAPNSLEVRCSRVTSTQRPQRIQNSGSLPASDMSVLLVSNEWFTIPGLIPQRKLIPPP